MNETILAVLKDIREEAKQTNVRLDSAVDTLTSLQEEAKQTNLRLVSMEGRVEFLEKRTSRGFETLNEQIESLARRQEQSENRVAIEIVALASITREVRDAIVHGRFDRDALRDHEKRIRKLETREEK